MLKRVLQLYVIQELLVEVIKPFMRRARAGRKMCELFSSVSVQSVMYRIMKKLNERVMGKCVALK